MRAECCTPGVRAAPRTSSMHFNNHSPCCCCCSNRSCIRWCKNPNLGLLLSVLIGGGKVGLSFSVSPIHQRGGGGKAKVLPQQKLCSGVRFLLWPREFTHKTNYIIAIITRFKQNAIAMRCNKFIAIMNFRNFY